MKRLLYGLLFTSPLSFLVLIPSASSSSPQMGICAHTIRDQTTAVCMEADTTPTIGRLYPLSTSLNVSAAGDVNVGTTVTGGKLHVRETGTDTCVYADKTSSNGTTPAVLGETDSDDSSAFALHGLVSPTAAGSNSSALRAQNNGTGGSGVAVWGSQDGSGIGLYGYTPTGTSIEGRTSSGIGILARRTSSTGTTAACVVTSASTDVAAPALYAEVTSPNFDSKAVYGYSAGSSTAGIGVHGRHTANGWGVYGQIDGTGSGGVGVRGYAPAGSGYAIYAAGTFGASGTKSFVQPHPTDPSKELRFVCLEGNESGTYFRGKSAIHDGIAVIDVPEDFRLVSEKENITVQVTAKGPAMLWVEEESLDQIIVRGSADVAFDYFVNGVRRGFADHQVEHENGAFRPQYRDEPFGAELPLAVRQILVDNGILNADFTPNENTAARLGWTLVDRPKSGPVPPLPMGDPSLPQAE
jgi:hypothetical protein